MLSQKLQLTKYYGNEVKQLFRRHIKGVVPNLDHMCVSVARPDGTLMMLSPIPNVEEHYYSSIYARHDTGLSSKMYKNFAYYCWKDGTTGPLKANIDDIKESVYGLYSGYFISQKVGDYYLIFGIASHCQDPRMSILFYNQLDNLLEACNFYYMNLRHKFQSHTNMSLPKVNNFTTIDRKIIRPDFNRARYKNKAICRNNDSNIVIPFRPSLKHKS